MPDRYTLREAAKSLGVSLPTVRRLITREQIKAQQFQGPHGPRWEIEAQSVHAYRANLVAQGEPVENLELDAVDQAPDVVEPVQQSPRDAVDQGREVVDAVRKPSDDAIDQRHEAVEAVWTLESDAVDQAPDVVEPVHARPRDAVDQAAQAPPDALDYPPMIPLSAHLRALDISSRLLDRTGQLEQALLEAEQQRDQERRRAESLAMELNGYKRALSEQAESLFEERALRLAAEESSPKISTPMSSGPHWGSRLKRWLGMKTG